MQILINLFNRKSDLVRTTSLLLIIVVLIPVSCSDEAYNAASSQHKLNHQNLNDLNGSVYINYPMSNSLTFIDSLMTTDSSTTREDAEIIKPPPVIVRVIGAVRLRNSEEGRRAGRALQVLLKRTVQPQQIYYPVH